MLLGSIFLQLEIRPLVCFLMSFRFCTIPSCDDGDTQRVWLGRFRKAVWHDVQRLSSLAQCQDARRHSLTDRRMPSFERSLSEMV